MMLLGIQLFEDKSGARLHSRWLLLWRGYMVWGITAGDPLPLLGYIGAYAMQRVGTLCSRPDHLPTLILDILALPVSSAPRVRSHYMVTCIHVGRLSTIVGREGVHRPSNEAYA
ncbi:hypothetical protein PIB30_069619 [Stylosanthes scabra]|uniref:Uncharacterized protein n=1 Tax=Stylosanthes scabra TaxID=79078 RepID=A0ABU6WLI8_9FABA|nr:hypothetical protein [Stylosanthes scabra]